MSPCVLVWSLVPGCDACGQLCLPVYWCGSWFLGVMLVDSCVSLCTGVVPRCDACGQLCLPVYWHGPWFLGVMLEDSCVSPCTGVVPGS